MIKVIAIDDEPLALMVIENYCSRNEHVELVKTFSNLKDAQKYINQFPIDLMFLDIQISRTNGMEFYKNMEKKIPVIFTTAFAEYAVDGFNVYHLRHRSLILLHKPLDVLILNRSSCHKLKLQISTARQIGGNASCFKSEFSKKTADTNTHKNLLLRNQSTSTVFSSTAS